MGYRTPKDFFLYLLPSPKFWWETKVTPDGENWFRAKLRLGVQQMEKSDGYIHVFMRRQADDISADFSWRHMQPEVEIHQNRT